MMSKIFTAFSYEILFYFSIALMYSVKKWKGFKPQPCFFVFTVSVWLSVYVNKDVVIKHIVMEPLL